MPSTRTAPAIAGRATGYSDSEFLSERVPPGAPSQCVEAALWLLGIWAALLRELGADSGVEMNSSASRLAVGHGHQGQGQGQGQGKGQRQAPGAGYDHSNCGERNEVEIVQDMRSAAAVLGRCSGNTSYADVAAGWALCSLSDTLGEIPSREESRDEDVDRDLNRDYGMRGAIISLVDGIGRAGGGAGKAIDLHPFRDAGQLSGCRLACRALAALLNHEGAAPQFDAPAGMDAMYAAIGACLESDVGIAIADESAGADAGATARRNDDDAIADGES